MPQVFVTQENQGLDYTPAEEYGEVRFITRKEWSPIKGSLMNQEIMREVKFALNDFKPEEDFLVVSGSPTIAALVFLHLGQKRYENIKLLRWSNRDHIYQLVTLEV